MAHYLTPHSAEWFKHLDQYNPKQTAHTRAMIKKAGNDKVCSVCGEEPAADYYLYCKRVPADAVLTLRLCNDCKGLRAALDDETFLPFPDKSAQ